MTIENVKQVMRNSDDDIFDDFAPWESDLTCYIYCEVILDHLFELFNEKPNADPFKIIEDLEKGIEEYVSRHPQNDTMFSVYYYSLEMLLCYLQEKENEFSRTN